MVSLLRYSAGFDGPVLVGSSKQAKAAIGQLKDDLLENLRAAWTANSSLAEARGVDAALAWNYPPLIAAALEQLPQKRGDVFPAPRSWPASGMWQEFGLVLCWCRGLGRGLEVAVHRAFACRWLGVVGCG